MSRSVVLLLLQFSAAVWGLPAMAAAQETLQPGLQALALSVETSGAAAVQQAADRVDLLAASGDLRLVSSRADGQLAGRRHQSLRQYHLGVPVRGGGVTVQRDGGGAISIFGTIHADIDIGVVPQVSAAQAVAAIQRISAAEPAAGSEPELLVVPRLTGGHALAWRITMDDFHEYGLNAHTGDVEYRESLLHRESAVGAGAGIAGQRKKVSVRRAGGRYEAFDELRPAEIATLDVRFNERRLDQLLDRGGWSALDLASDADNDWSDPAVVDAHAYTGFTYDYLLDVHGWRGIDGRNGRVLSIVNAAGDLIANNAFFMLPPFGPEGRGVFAYSAWEDTRVPLVAADVVAHELMHGVTYFSVYGRTRERLGGITYIGGPRAFRLGTRTARCGQHWRYSTGKYAGRWFYYACLDDGRFLLYANDGDAVNEAYSDIVGTAVEFAVHAPGLGPLRADYRVGEDTGRTLRSLENPRSMRLAADIPFRYPDAYQHLFRVLIGIFVDGNGYFVSPFGSVDGGRTITVLPTLDYWGHHWNSTILSHAYYLAVEGGRNRTTGLSVQGVGAANRAQVERVFVRAMTHLMPATTHFHLAAAVIRQSAVDLHGRSSSVYRAVNQALNAVGLREVR